MFDTGVLRVPLGQLLSGPNAVDVQILKSRADRAGANAHREFDVIAPEILERLKVQFQICAVGNDCGTRQEFFSSLRDIQTSSAIANSRQIECLASLLLKYLPVISGCDSRSLAMVELQLNAISTIAHKPLCESEFRQVHQELAFAWQCLVDGSLGGRLGTFPAVRRQGGTLIAGI